MPKTELFGTPSCPYTREMREWLEFRGRDFVEYNVDADPPARPPESSGGKPAPGARAGGRRQSGADRLARAWMYHCRLMIVDCRWTMDD